MHKNMHTGNERNVTCPCLGILLKHLFFRENLEVFLLSRRGARLLPHAMMMILMVIISPSYQSIVIRLASNVRNINYHTCNLVKHLI